MSAAKSRAVAPIAHWKSRYVSVLVALLLGLSSLCMARRAPAAGKVTLLQPTPSVTTEWPAATRATIAELVLAGFEVTVKRTRHVALDAVLGELHRETLDPRVVAALFITRSRHEGLGYVWLAGSAAPIEVREKNPDLAVSHSSLALRLAELLRKRHLHLPPIESPGKPELTTDPEQRGVAPHYTLGPRLGFGVAGSNGATASVATLGMFLTWHGKLTGTLDLRRTLSTLDVDTTAGIASIRYTELAASFSWNFLRQQRGIRTAAGLSYGALWLSSDAAATPEYIGRPDATTTSTLAAVFQVGYGAGPLGLDLVLEPGLLLPALRVTAADTTVVSLGRPWLSAFAVVTWGA